MLIIKYVDESESIQKDFFLFGLFYSWCIQKSVASWAECI